MTLSTEQDFEEAVKYYTVFGRVTPEQKRYLVRAFQKQGHTVAMTGDGVNDVLALKEADCSIAMASGSDAARTVSSLVLLDSNFASMPVVVQEGRRSINNLQRSSSLFWQRPFSRRLSRCCLSSSTTATLPAGAADADFHLDHRHALFILALEPNENLVQGKFLRNAILRALPAAFTDLFIIIFVLLFQQAFQINNNEISTITALLVTIVGFFMLWKVAKPVNRLHGGHDRPD